MSINFYTNNSYQQYPQLQKDINDVKSSSSKSDAIDKNIEKGVLGALPPFRRIMSLPDKFDNGDGLAATGLAAIMIANLPEDIRDIKSSYGQVCDILSGRKYVGKYDHTKYQHDFSFFKGTLFEEWNKNSKNKTVKKAFNNLYEQDESLYNTSLGEKVQKWLGITNGERIESKAKNRFGTTMYVSEVKAPNAFAELTGRAMKRTTKLGIIALGVLELPKIIKAMSKGDNIPNQAENTAKQITKSGINLASITAGIAYGGAFGAKKFGAAGSLVGMGLGAVAGALGSNKLQSLVG